MRTLLRCLHRELLAVHEVILTFQPDLRLLQVALFCDNTTAVSYLKKSGGTRSVVLIQVTQDFLHLCESLQVSLLPQFISRALNVQTDALSRGNQVF